MPTAPGVYLRTNRGTRWTLVPGYSMDPFSGGYPDVLMAGMHERIPGAQRYSRVLIVNMPSVDLTRLYWCNLRPFRYSRLHDVITIARCGIDRTKPVPAEPRGSGVFALTTPAYAWDTGLVAEQGRGDVRAWFFSLW